MSVGNASKILAAIIKMYRTSYLTSAKIGAAGGPRAAIMKALLSSKMMQPKMTIKQISKMAPEDLIKIAQGWKK